jgi:hypothetical protein
MAKRRPLTRKQQTQKQKRKQKGGFYPSVMGGIGNAAYLAVPAIRLGVRLFKSKKTRKQKHRK